MGIDRLPGPPDNLRVALTLDEQPSSKQKRV